jgi:hypothetical protein
MNQRWFVGVAESSYCCDCRTISRWTTSEQIPTSTVKQKHNREQKKIHHEP